jgi:hypothetical protein
MMTYPVTGGAAATAAALLDAAALIEQSGLSGLYVSCYEDRVTISASTSMGDACERAAALAMLSELAGAGPGRQRDSRSGHPAAWLSAAGHAGGTIIEITAHLAVRAVPGGTLAAGPDGQQSVIPAGQQLLAGWRWVTDLDGPGAGQQQAVA